MISPCGKFCPGDCPCEHFNCASLDDNSNILILYTNSDFSKKPALMTQTGEMRILDNFIFERETVVSYSCSVTLKGEMMVFGSDLVQFNKQISTVGACTLKRR